MIHSQYAPAALAKGSLSDGTVQPFEPVQHLPSTASATPGSPGGSTQAPPATEVAAWALLPLAGHPSSIAGHQGTVTVISGNLHPRPRVVSGY